MLFVIMTMRRVRGWCWCMGAPDRSKNFAAVVDRLADLPVTVYDRRGYGKALAGC